MTMVSTKRARTGASLMEVLVVIVIFLIGILALVQVYPGGLALLRTTRNNSIATALARAEIERLKGMSTQLPEAILPVSYFVSGGTIVVQPDPSRTERDLMPRGDRIDQQGRVWDGVRNRGYWAVNSGANVWSRVIGEGRVVPSPRFVGQEYGGLLALQFAPAYYDRDPTTGIGYPGGLEVYANNMIRRIGNRNRNRPDPYNDVREWMFFYVEGTETGQGEPFAGEDQVWLPAHPDPSRPIGYRVQVSFTYSADGQDAHQVDSIYRVDLNPTNPPPYAAQVGRYYVVSIPELITQPDSYGRNPYQKSGYLGTDLDGLSIARSYREVVASQPFFNGDPYEYKVLNANLGFILLNPASFGYQVQTGRGRVDLQARADYTVFDWRIIRDDFRVPITGAGQQKLLLGSLKVKGRLGPDSLTYRGIGIGLPGVFGDVDNDGSGNDVDQNDFVLVDMETGGVYIGNLTAITPPNDPARARNSYVVDKSLGVVTFNDVDNDPSNGLSAYLVLPDATSLTGWSMTPTLIPDIRGRPLRALYQARNEWSPHVIMASRRYRVTWLDSIAQIQTGECYVGTSNPNLGGDARRVYFAHSEVGKKVIVGEMWYVDGMGQTRLLLDQEFLIRNDVSNNFQLPYIDIRDKVQSAAFFDFSNGYAVRRVSGASVTVRVLWNPDVFALTNVARDNLVGLDRWMRGWRKTSIETFLMGGQ